MTAELYNATARLCRALKNRRKKRIFILMVKKDFKNLQNIYLYLNYEGKLARHDFDKLGKPWTLTFLTSHKHCPYVFPQKSVCTYVKKSVNAHILVALKEFWILYSSVIFTKCPGALLKSTHIVLIVEFITFLN